MGLWTAGDDAERRSVRSETMAVMVEETKHARVLADKLSGRRFGTTLILRVEPHIDFDSDDQQTIFLTVVLSDPVGDTWPLDDVLGIRREVFSQARANRLGLPVHVRLVPKTDPPQEDDDEEPTSPWS